MSCAYRVHHVCVGHGVFRLLLGSPTNDPSSLWPPNHRTRAFRHAAGAHPPLIRERLHQPCRDSGPERGHVHVEGRAKVGGVHQQDDGEG